MSDHIFCLSNCDEPGLIRLTSRSLNGCNDVSLEREILKPGERVEWSLKVRDARVALSAVKRSMKRYRKSRGNGIFRCCPLEARSIAIKYTTMISRDWKKGHMEVRDNIYASMLTVAFLVTVFSAQTADLGTKYTISLTASVLTALIIGTAYMTRPDRFKS